MHRQPRVRKKQTHELVTTGSPDDPAFPAQWFYGLFRALPGDRAFLPPSPRESLAAKLGASVGAPGPHGFAVRNARSFVLRAALRPPRPCPTSVTIAIRPSGGQGMAARKPLIWGASQGLFGKSEASKRRPRRQMPPSSTPLDPRHQTMTAGFLTAVGRSARCIFGRSQRCAGDQENDARQISGRKLRV
jgi:hypothetical protein